MKKLLIQFMILSALAVNFASAETKIVTVSMQKLFDGYYKSEEANARVQSIRDQAFQEAQTKETELQGLAEKIQGMQEELENPMLSESAKTEKENELRAEVEAARAKQMEYQRWQQEISNEMNRRRQQISNGIIEEITKVVNSIALKNYSADLVLDTSDILGNGVPVVLYADSSLDITDVVMVELNKKAPAEEASAE